MSNILQNARRAGLLQQELYHKRQAEKKPKNRARSRVHKRKK
ncbi:hypothetical protein [Acutalibacter muris]|nr:hypothetical protein [Acutalibacter muris]